MILATVGTHHAPFTRAVEVALAAAARAGEPLIVQHGHTPPIPGHMNVRWHRWLPPAELSRLVREASLVVAHAGVSTLVEVLAAGHRPIVVPRRRHLGEHVDDHQLEIVTALAAEGRIDPYPAGIAPPAPATARSPAAWPVPGLKQAVWSAVAPR